MKYESVKSPKGNVGVSWTSQELADAQAAAMDATNCRYCTNCTGCRYCTNCTGCRYCTNCTNCTGCRYCTNCTGCTGCRYCTGCTNCTNCTNCTDCRYCRYCTGCTNCTNCTDCSTSTGILKWAGTPAENLIGLNGLSWPAAFSVTHIQIGCQNHSIEEWEGFDDRAIAAMDGRNALSFWKANKPLILSIARR